MRRPRLVARVAPLDEREDGDERHHHEPSQRNASEDAEPAVATVRLDEVLFYTNGRKEQEIVLRRMRRGDLDEEE